MEKRGQALKCKGNQTPTKEEDGLKRHATVPCLPTSQAAMPLQGIAIERNVLPLRPVACRTEKLKPNLDRGCPSKSSEEVTKQVEHAPWQHFLA